MGTYLDGIVAWHRARAHADARDPDALREVAHVAELPRPFADRLREAAPRGAGKLAVIAEIKRRSPSRGPISLDLDAAEVALDYEAGGATCLSVLTDAEYFGGCAADLVAARQSTALPVLRKDFTVCGSDIFDARIMGADAVLLIAAALSDHELEELSGLARELVLDAIVEVHDAEEMRRAEGAGAAMIGVNQRDLRSFEIDRRRALDLAEQLPSGVIAVAESGIRRHDDVACLADAGYQAVLVGEHLVTAADRRAAVRTLAGSGATASCG